MAHVGTGRAAADRRRARGVAVRVLAAVLVLGAAACSSDGGTDADAAEDESGRQAALPAGWDGHTSDVYADDANWLCRPDVEGDVCAGEDLDATAVAADLSTEPVDHVVADDPPVDCFYVYPTVSQDAGLTADLAVAENQEVWVARNQAARFTGACRVYAPIYRQRTISAIGGGGGAAGEEARATAYADVLDAFQHYMANDNEGRGVVLIGHSQGAGILTELIRREVDDQPALRDRLVSALLLGTTIEVPDGQVVGGTFGHVPLCEADDQTGCVVTYATFPADSPPPPEALFGRARTAGNEAACVNPAALGGGAATLQPYFPTAIPVGALSGDVAAATMDRLALLDTGWVTMPDYVQGQCTTTDGATYLAVTVGSGPTDQRGTDIGGDLGPTWGLHLVDVNVAIGDLVDLVRRQGDAFADGPS